MMAADSLGARLWALVFKPGQAMQWVRDRPQWLMAALIMVVVLGLFTGLTAHIASPEQMELMRDSRLMQMMPQEDWQQAYEESLQPSMLKRVTSGLGGGLGSCVFLFIYALVYLLFSKLAGGQGTFKQILGVTFWSAIIPYVLGSLIKLPLVFAKQSVMEVSLGLAALASGAELTSGLYMALTMFGDFFVWWGLIVTIIGFQKIHGFSRGTASAVVLLPWLLITGVMYGIGRLFM